MKRYPMTVLAFLMIIAFALVATGGPAGDSDGDGTYDVLDFCSSNPNAPSPNGCDTDLDGYGNQCDADFNNDGLVGFVDFGNFGALYNTTGAPGFVAQDMDCDGSVGFSDFGLFGQSYNGFPGPSGLSCAGTIPCQ